MAWFIVLFVVMVGVGGTGRQAMSAERVVTIGGGALARQAMSAERKAMFTNPCRTCGEGDFTNENYSGRVDWFPDTVTCGHTTEEPNEAEEEEVSGGSDDDSSSCAAEGAISHFHQGLNIGNCQPSHKVCTGGGGLPAPDLELLLALVDSHDSSALRSFLASHKGKASFNAPRGAIQAVNCTGAVILHMPVEAAVGDYLNQVP
jgi:hypothetical protein